MAVQPDVVVRALDYVRRSCDRGGCSLVCEPLLDELLALPADELRELLHEFLSMGVANAARGAFFCGIPIADYITRVQRNAVARSN